MYVMATFGATNSMLNTVAPGRSGRGDPDFIRNANERQVPGMCRALIGCAVIVPGWAWGRGGSGAFAAGPWYPGTFARSLP